MINFLVAVEGSLADAFLTLRQISEKSIDEQRNIFVNRRMKNQVSDLLKNSHWRLGSLYFSFPDENHSRNFFAFEALKLIQRYKQNSVLIDHQIGHLVLTEQTKKRLELAKSSDLKQAELFSKLLKFLDFEDIKMDELLTYLQHRPGPSALSPNFDNSFRDWCWGQEEINLYSDSLQKVLGGQEGFEKVLCLGSGSGRLCYEFFLKNKVSWSVFVDFNPLLLKISEQVIRGEHLQLFEAPTIPSEPGHYKILRELKAPQAIQSGIEHLVADARTTLFKPKTFSTVLTPWLIDAIDMPLPDLMALINSYLVVGGHWLSTGPLHLDKKELADHFLKEEIIEFAQQAGFELVATHDVMAPYMKSAESGSYRIERVHSFNFKKIKDVEVKDFNLNHLEPSWWQNADEKIQLPIATLNLVRGHEVNAHVLSLVDGQHSLNQIAAAMAKDFGGDIDKVRYLCAQIIKNALMLARQQIS